MSKKMVLRYAPSPTGAQHVGGIRTALYCYFLAQQNDGELILRIEDTDQKRFVEGAEEYIIEAANWIGIEFTQGVHLGGPHAPYRQSERKDFYRKYADQLLESGHAYIAFDTPEEIDAMRKNLEASGMKSPKYNFITRGSMKNSLTLPEDEVKKRMEAGDPYVIRFKVPRKEEVRFHDEVRKWVVIHSSHIDDKVLMKSDGLPTYHLANIVDDHLMEVTHVVRGEEWLPSAPLHVLLYKAFGWEDSMPKFAHLPLLSNPDGSKMSKRTSFKKFGISVFPLQWNEKETDEVWPGYREMGYLPETMMNYLSLLGWHPGSDEEIMTREELIEKFSLERVHKSAAKFDLDKLKHFNQVFIRKKTDEEVLELLQPHLEAAGLQDTDRDYLLKVVALMKERIYFLKEIIDFGQYFFHDPAAYDEKMTKKKWNAKAADILDGFREKLEAVENWDTATIESVFKAYLAEREIGTGKLLAPLRLALTGMSFGPSCFEISELLGKAGTLDRIRLALEKLPVENQA